jgi:Flp pilus assembly protein TadD
MGGIKMACVGALVLAAGMISRAQTPPSVPATPAELLTVEGIVQIFPVTGTGWVSATTNQMLQIGDRLRTLERSRATVRLSELTVLRLNELTTLQIRGAEHAGAQSLLDVKSGSVYFLGREKPAKQEFQTPLTSGAIRGTEFNLSVAGDGRTVVALVEGGLTLSNQVGQVDMASGDEGVVEPGKAPVKSPMVEAINIMQWCLYYPGVLDVSELDLTADERQALSAPLADYNNGDLLQAVAQYPADRQPGSDSEKVFRAALLLSAGQVEQAESLLTNVATNTGETNRAARLATSLREVIAAVKNQAGPREAAPGLATEWLAESYYLQAHARLAEALKAARSAVAVSPSFGFGWARVAELELSFGRLPESITALNKSIELSPRNAQSPAVRGFIELAQGRANRARASFDEAISMDGALGNAWIGRGLCEIRLGDVEAGRRDIQAACVLEPQRAVFRSYLGKAFGEKGDSARAKKELGLAEQLDPNDPTAWLYQALIEQNGNEINPAVRDLEESKNLNDNRQIFRSRLLLDEDQAVRSANLARIYQDTGVLTWDKDLETSDWGYREASRAVDYDYGNYAAHQFLANNYDALRDPQQINLRYETPWFGELIMSDLLSPVSAGNLSDFSSQQQYARLFEQNHFGLSSDTEYLSRGDWLERASQFGTHDDVTYAIDDEYRSENGSRVNNDLQQNSASAKAKVQLTPQDSLFVEGSYYYSRFGDTAQYYNQYGTVPGVLPVPSSTFQGKEWQQPDVFVGYHHEWGPGSHTVILGGYLNDTLEYDDPMANIIFTADSFGSLVVNSFTFPVDYHREFNGYTGEAQQILQTPLQTAVVGARYQKGWNNTTASEVDNTFNAPPLTISQTDSRTTLERFNVYGYETVNLFDCLALTGGVAYDHLNYPLNVEIAPVSTAQNTVDQISPKAGLIWTITPDTFFRFAYTRSLGGLSFDNSVRLEPTQVGGFNQAFRSIIPESVAGVVPASRFTTYGVGLDQSFKTHTYLTVEGQILDSDGTRYVGVLTNTGLIFPIPRGANNVPQTLGYSEETLAASALQLLGNDWSLGGRYQLSHARLNSEFTGLLPPQEQGAQMQQGLMYVNFYHPSGFFSQAQAIWTKQDNYDYSPALAGADFWQFNAYAGYRFFHRAAEVKVGILNIANKDYLLNPLNLYYDLPRERTLAASFKFYF